MMELEARIRACRICVEQPVGPPLPHPPRPVLHMSTSARVCIAGQAPGARVHASGIPFDDRSGDRLREWMGIDRAEFYDRRRLAIVPMGFCFPGYDDKGSDKPPRSECRAAWHDRVFAAMPQIELVIAIGMYAQAFHLGDRRSKTMTATAMDWHRHLNSNEHRAVLPIPHPSWRNTAWLRKNPWFETDVLPVLRERVARLL
ncbi:MAG: uracil-DNA glycosylase family protein [Pseudomonadota bacterium]